MNIKSLPANWNLKTLGTVCKEITAGGAAPQGENYFFGGNYPFVRVADMGKMKNSEKYLSSTKDKLNDSGIIRLRKFPAGTVLFTKSGASLLLNQRAILKIPMYVVSHIGCMIPGNDVTSDWLYYFMRQVDFAHYSHATTLPSLKLSTLKSVEIPVPPLSEQERIVARIEELFSELDKAVETLQTTKRQLKVYRQAVLKEAFEGKLTMNWRTQNNVPYHFEYVSVTNIVKKEKNAIKAGPFGSSLKKDCYVEYGYKIYGQEQVIAGNEHIGDYYIDKKKYDELYSCRISPGDVLISLVGTVGKVLILSEKCEPGIINPRLIKISLDQTVMLPKFFKYYFECDYLKSLYKSKAHGETMDVLNLSIIKELPFVLCSIDEQEEIIQQIESRLSVCDSIEQTVDSALSRADALRQSILKEAFEGRLA